MDNDEQVSQSPLDHQRSSDAPSPSKPASTSKKQTSPAEAAYTEKSRKALQACFVQKFEVLGLLNLLHLQWKIHRLKSEVFVPLREQYFPDDVISSNPVPSGGDNANTEKGDSGDDKTDDSWILKLFERVEGDPQASLDLQARLDPLMGLLDVYNKAILQQRQILSLPAYDIEISEGHRKHFQYFQESDVPNRLKYADPALFKSYSVHKNRSGSGEYASLDPCTCPTICPTVFASFVNIGTWTRENAAENVLTVLALVLLSTIPTGSIIALYAVPSSWGRIGFIIAESAIVIACLAATRKLTDGDVLAYMMGIAAIQVVFVGSTIASR